MWHFANADVLCECTDADGQHCFKNVMRSTMWNALLTPVPSAGMPSIAMLCGYLVNIYSTEDALFVGSSDVELPKRSHHVRFVGLHVPNYSFHFYFNVAIKMIIFFSFQKKKKNPDFTDHSELEATVPCDRAQFEKMQQKKTPTSSPAKALS
mmetsp:Transcript_11678/g.20862  ORF Transcript_11678/g.20862 Transcript_11678/m.20862 type:complete len:152 (-) Transcript_11678:35-490(-)